MTSAKRHPKQYYVLWYRIFEKGMIFFDFSISFDILMKKMYQS